MTFEDWKARVDEILLGWVEMKQDDLPDWLARDAYDDGLTPEEGAHQCLEDAGYAFNEKDEDDYDDRMDGDTASALASVGWGTDEDYGVF
jgi:hypothetical protein